MSVSSWWRTKRILRARQKSLRNQEAELREFVYLDEVSVYSLLASRRGALATEFTETEASSLKAEVNASVQAGIPSLKAGLGSKMESGTTQTSQVVRKVTIQSAFKDLYESEQRRLVLGRPVIGAMPPPPFSADEIPSLAARPEYGQWILHEHDLARGALIEIDVNIEAEALYKVTTVIATLAGILKESGDLIPGFDSAQLVDVTTIYAVLDRLQAGLIPVQGVASDFFVVEVKGEFYVIHRAMLSSLRDAGVQVLPLCVTGVAEGRLFWKDARQVLFSSAQYAMLCRVVSPGLKSEWQPLKIVDLVSSAIPGFGDELNTFGETALTAMARGAEASRDRFAERSRAAAVRNFAQSLEDAYEFNFSAEDEAKIDEACLIAEAAGSEFRLLRSAFSMITELCVASIGREVDPVQAVQWRSASLLGAGLSLDGSVTPGSVVKGNVPDSHSRGVYLDTEIVAIYW